MAYNRYRDIKVICDGKLEYFRDITIHSYLPKLWEIVKEEPGVYFDLEQFIENHFQTPIDRHLQRALRYLFEYVKELERREASERLLDRLERSWKSFPRGRNETLRLFESLGTILRLFGCHPEISSPMVSFLTRHIPEIIHGHPETWIDYVRVLEEIDVKKKDMRNVLSYILKESIPREGTLPRYMDTLEENTIRLFGQILQEKKERQQELRLHYERHSRRRAHGLGDREMIVYPNIRGGYIVRDPFPTVWDHRRPPRAHWPQLGSPEDDWYHDGYLDDDEYYLSEPIEFYDDKIARMLERRRNLHRYHDKLWGPRVFH